MTQVSNRPKQETPLLLEARKSFALGIYITDQNDGPLDIAGSTLRIVMRKNVPTDTVDDTDNLIVNSLATLTAPVMGFANFFLQASDLDHAPGTYYYAIVLTYAGYSAVVAKGPIELAQNPEFSSVGETYSPVDASTALVISMREQTVIKISTGPNLPPGATTYTFAEQDKINQIFAGMVAAGTTLTADDITDGVSKVMMTVAEREALSDLSVNWADIEDKPTFGTASEQDTTAFLPAAGIDASKVISGVLNNNRVPTVFELRGISDGTGAPPSGNPFTLYLKHS